jgi:hypothetical protein
LLLISKYALQKKNLTLLPLSFVYKEKINKRNEENPL